MVVSVNNPALGSLQKILVSNIKIDDVALNLSSSEIKSVEIGNSENSHEYSIITTQLTKKNVDSFVNKTATFSYGKLSQRNNFFGYVISVTPNVEYQQDSVFDIFCMGVTWHMQNGSPKFFENTTVPSAFINIVTSYKLGVQVDDHSYSWPVLAQTDESDWEFLQTLAKRLGYCIYNYRGLVRLVDPVRILTSTGVFNKYIKGDDVLDPSRELLDWQATTQSLQIRETMKPVYGYFETSSNNRSSVALSRPLTPPYKMNTDTPVKDWGMAKAYNDAWDKRVDYWDQQASARVNGNALLIPGINISVQVSGIRNIKNDYDGVWMVRGVKHVITHNSFQTQLDLSRDTRVTPVNTDFRWFWAITEQGSPMVLRRDTGSTLHNSNNPGAISTSLVQPVVGDSNEFQSSAPSYTTFWESSWSKPERITQYLPEVYNG